MITILQVSPLVEPLDWIRPNRKIMEQEKRNRIKNVCIRRHHNNTLHASMLLLEIQTYISPLLLIVTTWVHRLTTTTAPQLHCHQQKCECQSEKRGIGARQKFKSVRLNPVNFTWNHFTSFLSSPSLLLSFPFYPLYFFLL